jgi:N-acetylglutamate synthase-like GNAT family acetyltransferase
MLPHLSVYLAAGGRVLVTELDGRIVGFVLARTVGPYLFADHPAWIIDLLFVALDARRRGVGRSLVAGIAALAGENDAPHVYVGASAGDRGMQRFLARLGFAPAAGHRVVATSTLLRRLALDGAVPARRGRRDATRAAIEDVVARRRRFREASATTGQIDLREGRAS